MPSPINMVANRLAPIDCHALVVADDRARYPLSLGASPVGPDEFEACTGADRLPALIASDTVAGAVLVQRNRFYGFDNSLILDLAASDRRLRALASVDTRRKDCADEARRLLALPGVAGLRMMEPSKGDDLRWLDGPHARQIWTAIANFGGILDIHVFPWNREAGLAALARLMEAFPDVPVLLDNLGNGPIEQGAPDHGFDAAVATLLDRPGLTFKFSDMILGRIERAGLDATQTVAAVARRIGADRLVWGSDLLATSQSLPVAADRAIAATAALAEADRKAILSGNAASLFGFNAG